MCGLNWCNSFHRIYSFGLIEKKTCDTYFKECGDIKKSYLNWTLQTQKWNYVHINSSPGYRQRACSHDGWPGEDDLHRSHTAGSAANCYHRWGRLQMRSLFCFRITMTSQWARWRLKLPGSRFLLNRLFRHRWKKASKLRVTGLC